MRARAALSLTALLITGASARGDEWVTYKSDDGRFSARMPAKAESKAQKVPDYGGYLDVRSLSADENKIAYAVYYHDIARTVTPSERDGFLKKQCNGTARSHNGAVRTIKPITVSGNPGREIVADLPVEGGGSAVLRARVVLVDKRLYQVIALAPEKQADRSEIATFLDSFEIIAPGDSSKRKRGR
jgi:hypothetical protein